MNRIQILETLQSTQDKYVSLLMKSYPTFPSDSLYADFGPPELCDLATQAHACAVALGTTATKRLFYIGFDVLYPFDNPVDLYSWRSNTKNNRVDHAMYLSIALRIDSEIKRMRQIIQFGGEAAYDELPTDLLLVSKDRYEFASPTNEQAGQARSLNTQAARETEALKKINAEESNAIKRLESLEQKTTIWANVSNILNFLRSFFGG